MCTESEVKRGFTSASSAWGFSDFLRKTGMGKRRWWGAGILVMLSYGRMTGSSLSALRAVCMFLVSVGAKICGPYYDMPSAGACGDPDHCGIAGQHFQLRLPAVLRAVLGAWDFLCLFWKKFWE